MLRRVKLAFLRSCRATGLQEVVARSRWRGRRLLILCYHGLSLDEEHRWRPNLYLQADLFRRRLEFLRDGGYSVLPLADGLRRLEDESLPPKAVAITFDDGFVDFLELGYPQLRHFGMPATVYLTTWYSGRREPVFGLMAHYLVWKGRGRQLDLSGLVPSGGSADLGVPAVRERTASHIVERAELEGRSEKERQLLLAELAERLGVDYRNMLDRRVLQIMAPSEVASLSSSVASVQLHTHRHRVPLDKQLFLDEIHENRAAIRLMRPEDDEPVHFCYPSGVHASEMLPWLRDDGVRSATTCIPGIAGPRDAPLMLPRFLDGENITWPEFSGWVSGVGALLPRRPLEFTAQ